MAFNIWKIGLHIQQHEALAVAVVHDHPVGFSSAGGVYR